MCDLKRKTKKKKIKLTQFVQSINLYKLQGLFKALEQRASRSSKLVLLL